MYTHLDVDLSAENGEDFNSTNLDIVGYDRESKTLYVEFQSGPEVYGYADVEESTYNLLVGAPSVGSFYAKHISGKYTSTKYDGNHVIEPRDADEDTDNVAYSSVFAYDADVALSVNVIQPAKYGVKWQNAQGTIGGNPLYEAIGEADALAQFNSAISQVFGPDADIKIVSVTHYFE
jgi:hypothetical protein